MLGRVVTATVGGNAFKYTITQDDLTAATATDAVSTSLSDQVVAKLTTSIHNAYLAGGTTFDATALAAGAALTITDSNTKNTLAATDGVTATVGDLTAINTSDITTGTSSYDALGSIDSALQTVNAERSGMGAVISRLQFASDNLTNISTKATESRSRIEDTDYSMATTELAKRNIIQQAAQAMLAQANQQPQMVLQLLK
jgi:flagellin